MVHGIRCMPANSNQGPSSVSAVSPAFAISVNYLNFTFDEFRAAYPGVDLFTFDPDLWAGLGAQAIQRRLAVYTQACPLSPSGPGCARPHSDPAVWGRLARA